MSAPEWTSAEHVGRYLSRADEYPRRLEGEGVLLDHVPRGIPRILDLGTGDGRLLALLRADRPAMLGVGLDFSALMLDAARERFAGDERIELVEHDLTGRCPRSGASTPWSPRWPSTTSSTSASARSTPRSSTSLEPGGTFANFEHVASPSHRLHLAFYAAIDEPLEHEDPSDRLLDVESQLAWLREVGFVDVDCYWKWLEMALLIARQAGLSGRGKQALARAGSTTSSSARLTAMATGQTRKRRRRAPTLDHNAELWAHIEPESSRLLLLSALDAFLARGYHAATTREIGERAGMSPAAVYVHWKAKHDLLFEISRIGHQAVLDVVEQALEQASDDPVERVHAFVSAFATWHAENHALARVIQYEFKKLPRRPVPPDRRDPRPLRGAHARRAGGRCRGRRLRRGRPRGHDARGALAVHRSRPLVRAVTGAQLRGGRRRAVCRPRAQDAPQPELSKRLVW